MSSWVLDDYYKAITNNDLIGVFCWSREKDRTDGCEAGANNATRAGGGHKDCVRYMYCSGDGVGLLGILLLVCK